MQAIESDLRTVFELAREEDDPGLSALLRETPMPGAIEVAFLREPSYLESVRTQGEFVQPFVARTGAKVAGAATRVVRPTFINGERTDAGYLGNLRLRPESRGGTVLARGYRFLRELHEDGRASIYSTTIVEDNRAALGVLTSGRAGLPRYTDQGRILTPMFYLMRRKAEIPADIRRAVPEDLPAIVAKLNENRLQFAPAWTESDFTGGRLTDFRIGDFHLLFRAGRLAGVMGTWDQKRFHQTVVVRYNGLLRVLRPAINLLRRPPLPEVGVPIPHFTVAFVSTDTVEDYRALFRRVHNDAIGKGYAYFVAGLHERDPRVATFEEYRRTPYAARLFAVTFEGPPDLDGRTPYMEIALL